MYKEIELLEQDIHNINFKNKPIHINYKYRAIFQICRIVLILGSASSKAGSSILKIQVLSDALEDKELFRRIEYLIQNNNEEFINYWRYNPLISKALSYSNAEGITQYTKTGKIVLAKKGDQLFADLLSDDTLLVEEKIHLTKIKKKLSDSKLLSILEKGDIKI